MPAELLTLTIWVTVTIGLAVGGVFTAAVLLGRRKRRPVRRAAELGRAALRAGRFDEAVNYLTVALRFVPEAGELYLRRAEAWHGLGKTRKAEADCDRAVELAPYTAEPYRVRGQIYAAANELAPAVADLLRAAELDANDADSLAFAAGLLLGAGQLEKAHELADRMVDRSPDHAEGYYLRGLVLERLGRFDDAFRQFTSALQLDPHRPDLPERLEKCKTAGGLVPVELVEVPPVTPPVGPSVVQLLRSAEQRLAGGHADAALADLTAALDLDPDNAAARLQRGWVWVNRGDFARGLTDFDRACYRLGDNPDALYGCGRCLQHAGEWAAAVGDYDRILTINPNIAVVRFHRAQCLLEMGESAAAVADLRAGVALDPKDVRLKNLLAWVLATCPADEVRDGPRAAELAREVVRAADTGEHRATLACALAEAGDFVTAVEHAQAALRDPKLPDRLRAEVTNYCTEFWAGRPVRTGTAVTA